MKKTIITLSTIISVFAQAQTDIKLNIQHLFNGEPMAFQTSFESPETEDLKISRLQYYISGIEFTHDGGEITDADDVFLLINAETNTNFNLGNFDITNLESIKFGIGVVETENHKDPSLYPSTHALAPQLQSMHWGWTSGYRFIALEGNAGAEFSNLFQFHALGDDNFHTQSIATSGQISGSELLIELDADYYNAFNSLSVADGPIEHGTTHSGCVTLINNFKTSVFSERVSAPVGLVEENSSFSLFPNPVSSDLNIQFVDDLAQKENISYQIVDVLGRKVVSSKQFNNSISVEGLTNGLYFVELREKDLLLGRESFLVKK